MSRHKRLKVASTILQTGIVPVFYHPDVETTIKVINACYDGGIRAFEFTNRGEFAHEVFGGVSRHIGTELPDMMVGIGSVFDAGTASLYLQLGADFVVSPVMNPEMARVCNRRKVMWAPGCGSLTEISAAEELGAEIVKMFPATQVGGPAFIKGVLGPSPWSLIMPTGGVKPNEDNLKSWFEAGAACVGMGSQLFQKSWIEAGEFSKITETAKVATTLAKQYSKHM